MKDSLGFFFGKSNVSLVDGSYDISAEPILTEIFLLKVVGYLLNNTKIRLLLIDNTEENTVKELASILKFNIQVCMQSTNYLRSYISSGYIEKSLLS